MKFDTFTSKILPLDRNNVDTDAIMPKQYLKMIGKTGYGQVLFDDWRYLDPGTADSKHSERRLNPDFILNDTKYSEAKILASGENFGCGSSREHAVWGLVDYGFRAVLAVSYADIFFSNAINNGLLPVALTKEEITSILHNATEDENYTIEIDLLNNAIKDSNGIPYSFQLSQDYRKRLLHGLDEISLILKYKDKIRKYEEQRREKMPWLSE